MGILGFSSWMKNVCKIDRLPKNITSLSIDCNSLFYNSLTLCIENAKIESDSENEKKLFKNSKHFYESYYSCFFSLLESIIEDVSPSERVLIAIDGVAPVAKMKNQRARRFLQACTDDEKRIFNSAQISPGTPWMMQMEKRIEKWIESSSKTYDIFFSSSSIQGEGEHKIFEMFRENEIEWKMKSQKSNFF